MYLNERSPWSTFNLLSPIYFSALPLAEPALLWYSFPEVWIRKETEIGLEWGRIEGAWRRWLAEKERLERCYKSRHPPIHTVPCSHGGRTEGRWRNKPEQISSSRWHMTDNAKPKALRVGSKSVFVQSSLVNHQHCLHIKYPISQEYDPVKLVGFDLIQGFF